MSDVTTEGAPAVAAQDPANLTGPGVTQNPANADSVFDTARISEENARLRGELIAENERLKAALADSRAAGVAAEGLSDEDVRMIEHPEEYDEAFATIGQHSILTDRLSALQTRLDSIETQRQQQQAPDVAPQAVPQPGAAVVTSDPLASQGPFAAGGTVGDGSSHGTASGDTAENVQPNENTTSDFSAFSDEQLAAELARREQDDTGA
jgi:hypothetical protein